jgi:TfoX/Sxy family transcriptional regulator of competence genes
MAFSENLADRLRIALASQEDLEEKKMMGGLTFMVNGKMCVGIVKEDLMLRLNPDLHDEVIERHGCREMDFTGKPMKGYVFVSPEAVESEKELAYWVNLGLDYNVVAKAAKKKRRKSEGRYPSVFLGILAHYSLKRRFLVKYTEGGENYFPPAPKGSHDDAKTRMVGRFKIFRPLSKIYFISYSIATPR